MQNHVAINDQRISFDQVWLLKSFLRFLKLQGTLLVVLGISKILNPALRERTYQTCRDLDTLSFMQ